MAVIFNEFPCTSRKVVLEPVWEGGVFKGVLRRYTAQVSVPGIGNADVPGGMLEVFQEAAAMTPDELAVYGAFAQEFDDLAVEKLGCVRV